VFIVVAPFIVRIDKLRNATAFHEHHESGAPIIARVLVRNLLEHIHRRRCARLSTRFRPFRFVTLIGTPPPRRCPNLTPGYSNIVPTWGGNNNFFHVTFRPYLEIRKIDLFAWIVIFPTILRVVFIVRGARFWNYFRRDSFGYAIFKRTQIRTTRVYDYCLATIVSVKTCCRN